MRFQIRCKHCGYDLPAEGPDESGTLHFDCPNCGTPQTMVPQARSLRVSVPQEEDPEDLQTCVRCGALLEQIYEPGGIAYTRCSARCATTRQGVPT
jgi:DNA-directed RNA polymerase subunit RPC12/RpoP